VITFFDVEVRDAAEGRRSDVDVCLGLDLAGAADCCREVLRTALLVATAVTLERL